MGVWICSSKRRVLIIIVVRAETIAWMFQLFLLLCRKQITIQTLVLSFQFCMDHDQDNHNQECCQHDKEYAPKSTCCDPEF